MTYVSHVSAIMLSGMDTKELLLVSKLLLDTSSRQTVSHKTQRDHRHQAPVAVLQTNYPTVSSQWHATHVSPVSAETPLGMDVKSFTLKSSVLPNHDAIHPEAP